MSDVLSVIHVMTPLEDQNEDEEEEYEVERILGHWVDDQGQRRFQIKWLGYDDNDNTEEPEDNLENAQELIAEYFAHLENSQIPHANANSNSARVVPLPTSIDNGGHQPRPPPRGSDPLEITKTNEAIIRAATVTGDLRRPKQNDKANLPMPGPFTKTSSQTMLIGKRRFETKDEQHQLRKKRLIACKTRHVEQWCNSHIPAVFASHRTKTVKVDDSGSGTIGQMDRLKSNQASSPFLRLPAEIRCMIAEEAFKSHVDIWHEDAWCIDECKSKEPQVQKKTSCIKHSTCGCRSDRPKKAGVYPGVSKPWLCDRVRVCSRDHRPRITSMWLACKQLYDETIAYLYTTPIFSFDTIEIFTLWLNLRNLRTIPAYDQRSSNARARTHASLIRNIDLPQTQRVVQTVKRLPNLSRCYINERIFNVKPCPQTGRKAALKDVFDGLSVRVVYHTCEATSAGYRDRVRLTGDQPHAGARPPEITVIQAGVVLPTPKGREDGYYRWGRERGRWYIKSVRW